MQKQNDSKDPLIKNFPIDDEIEKSILELIKMLGYDKDTFLNILKSILMEEVLDRITPDPITIDELKKKENHLKILKDRCYKLTNKNWDVKTVEILWERVRKLDSKYKRTNIPFSKKLQFLANNKNKCEICGKSPPEVKLHIDHIYAASRGGPNEFWNFRLLCDKHNKEKSNHLDWRLYL